MNDGDIAKLVSKLNKSLVTKDDLRKLEDGLEGRIDEADSRLGRKIADLGIKLGKKLDELNTKADTIMEFAQAVDETATDHEKRLKRIETVPAILHQIKN